ncbi:MAG: DUF721 domain-containing protein [Muribaculaceae bacterium]|nr:DUF721 domain-containing protein [Muribaculaceae bacterium]
MKRTSAQSIGEIFNEFLKQERLESQFNEQKALTLWPEIVGPGINRYTVDRTVKNGVMTVTISSAALRNELMLSRTAIIARINEALGDEVIHNIIFR